MSNGRSPIFSSGSGVEYAIWFGVAILVVFVLSAAESMLVPLAIAIGIWYLINAIAHAIDFFHLGPLHFPKWFRLLVGLFAILGFFYGIGALISDNIQAVAEDAPRYRANLEVLAQKIESKTGLPLVQQADEFRRQLDLTTWIQGIASAIGSVAGATGLIIIYVFFLLIEQVTFDRKLRALFHKPARLEAVRETLRTIQRRVRTYLWVKTLMSVLTGGLSYLIMNYVGLDYAEFWAFIIFLLNYIPTIGSLLGITFPAVMALVQFDALEPILIVVIGLTTIQVTIGNFLEPPLMGSSLNISPLVVMLSLVLWGMIWGVTGMFLGVPIMVVLIIILSQFEATRGIAIAMSANGNIATPEDDLVVNA